MRTELPTPEQILEELADRAALHIDRLAPVAFDAALDELVRYHRFLLAMNATRTTEGAAFNFSEVPGNLWIGPHQEWLRQYRRLFERATERLDNETDFLAKLARVPSRLLPRSNEFEISQGVLQSIVDLTPLLVHRLEAWVTKRTSRRSTSEEATLLPRANLAGSDARAYSDVVLDLVAAWESLLHDGWQIYTSKIDGTTPNEVAWAAYGRVWPFLWQHLTDSAYLLAIAVWNEDPTGAELYRDALVRWPVTLDSDFGDRYDLLNRRLIFPSILELDWADALKLLRPSLPEYSEPSANQLLASALRGAHDDVVLIAAALLIFWTLSSKRISKLGIQTAQELFERELTEPDDIAANSSRVRSFRATFLDFLRLEIAGARFERASYGSRLDRLVERLDAMTERAVVSGRPYTPSTLHERESLLVAMAATLVAALPEAEDDGVLKQVEELAADEDALPNGDRSLRDVLRGLNQLREVLAKPAIEVLQVATSLNPVANVERSASHLKAVVESAIDAISRHRLDRLKRRPLDQRKLEQLRVATEEKILTPPAGILFFRDFSIDAHRSEVVDSNFSVAFSGVSKAELALPPMETTSSNLTEAFSGGVSSKVGMHVWALFCQRPRLAETISSKIEDEEFWQSLRGLVNRVGNYPILVVSRQSEGRAIRRLLYPPQGHRISFTIERHAPINVKGNYIATVEGVEVFGADFDQGIAWLFSGHALKSVQYSALNAAGHTVTVDFEVENDQHGKLLARVRQTVSWTNTPIFELTITDPEESL